MKRHINQLYKTGVEKNNDTVTLAEPPAQQKLKIEEIQIERHAPDQNQHQPVMRTPQTPGRQDESVRRSARVRRPPAHFSDHVRY